MQIAVVLALIQAYEEARRVLHPDLTTALANARRIAGLERSIHVAWEHSLQAAILRVAPLVGAVNLLYFAGHFLLTSLFFLWLYRRSRSRFPLYRDAFLATTALALLVHWLFPTAPPRLADVGLLDTLRRSGIDIGSAQASSYYNPLAAMPSLHAAYALGVGIGLVRHGGSRWLRAAGIVYPPVVVWTIVVTGNHFLFDALAGFGVLGAGFVLALYWRPRRGVEQSGSSPGS
jgi:hypothetical protein